MTRPSPPPSAEASLARTGIRTPFDERPFLAIWELTQACDLVCAHCRASATPDRDAGELTTAEGKALLDTLARMRVPLVVLTGGDPAKREDLAELVAHGTAAGLVMAVTPSGTPRMTRERLVELKAAGVARLAVSVDGPDAETHDAFRGVVGSFAESLRILRTARELGVEVQVNTSVGPHNHRGLPAMAAFCRDVGAVLWSVFFVVPTGRAGASLLLGPARVEALLEELAELAHDAPFDVKTTAAPHFRRVQLERRAKAVGIHTEVDEHGVVVGARGINDGSGFVFVSHRGDVYPSGFLPVSAGNVRQADLHALYREHPLFRSLRDEDALHGKCGVCPFRRVCGGSRARAWATDGDVLGADPLCVYEPRAWKDRA